MKEGHWVASFTSNTAASSVSSTASTVPAGAAVAAAAVAGGAATWNEEGKEAVAAPVVTAMDGEEDVRANGSEGDEEDVAEWLFPIPPPLIPPLLPLRPLLPLLLLLLLPRI
jgi:hypothetical protein